MSTTTRSRRIVATPPVTTLPVPEATFKPVDLGEIAEGDIFSESSHYVFKKKTDKGYLFQHLESSTEVTLGMDYVENLLVSADQYHKEVEVSKEDTKWTAKQIADLPPSTNPIPREGDLKQKGIRTIWNEIDSQVFHVVFITQGDKISQTVLEQLKEEQIANALEQVDNAKGQKKSMRAKFEEALKQVQNNPIVALTDGKRRELYGYKTQFESSTGYFNVIDMKADPKNNRRQVNINTIQELTYKGIKYKVK